ncbi:MAG TPA: serine hydrolase domain-containing protein [Caulobacteraceae bacterium]|nr:serine hydrolase domain-containing protein [Caulobacteraceae bacterium]
MRAAVTRGDTAGLSAVVMRKGVLAYAVSIGMRDIDAGKQMQADTVFRIYSMTKPVVSVAAMILLEEGRLLLSDPVSLHLPELGGMGVFDPEQPDRPKPQAVEMSIADLMTHTAGLTYAGDPTDPVDRLYQKARLFRRGENIQDMVARLAGLPLKRQPGERFEYSIAHDVLGALVERAAGMRLGQFTAERIFAPLDMIDTAFEVPHDKVQRLATLYGPGEGGGLKILDEASHRSRWAAPVTLEAGGESLVSTVPDFLRFCEMLRNGGELEGAHILSRKSVELLTANRLSETQRSDLWMKGYGYGLGFGVLLDPALNANLGSRGEYTWAGSASTYFWVDPVEDMSSLLFLQLEPSSQLTIPRRFKALVHQALA